MSVKKKKKEAPSVELKKGAMKYAKQGAAMPLIQVLQWSVAGFLLVVPVARSWNRFQSGGWLAAWAVVYVIDRVWERFRLGSYVQRATRQFARINSSVAGSIDSLAAILISSPDRQFNEEQCKHLVVGLLHRIRDYTETAMDLPEEVELRATLAVPHPDSTVPPRELRVWCYDETHGNRQWTILPLGLTDGRALPGSPTAFLSGNIQIIEDLHALDDVSAELKARTFRSILSIPVRAGGRGKVLAVVNLDASEPHLFTPGMVQNVIMPHIAPSVNLVALALLMRKTGEKHVFGN